MNNKAHLKPSDYDNEGNILPMGYKRLNDGTIINTEEKDDLISREALKKLAIPCEIHNGALTDMCVPLYQIDNAPTVEETVMVDKSNFSKEQYNADLQSAYDCGYERGKNERQKGEWIDTGSGQECSVCHEIQYGYDNFRHFCANCGADMRGGAENDT